MYSRGNSSTLVLEMRKTYYFGYDLDNVLKVQAYVKDNYSYTDYEMWTGYGDDVMNALEIEVKEGDEKLLELISNCDGEGDFVDEAWHYTMNKYDVVCNMGRNIDMLRVIEAEDEKQARKIMWEKHMDDHQKDNCEDIEVFPIE